MHNSSSPTSYPQAYRWPLVLLLVALFAVFAAAPGMAQTQPAPAATAMPAATADFLATLAAVPASGQDGLTPSPVLDSGCMSNSQCPKGQLCCLACGYAGCETRACFVPMNGHCPFFP
jgi:hypothetical protein